ncbi:MAG TPA: c-type cytochrome [Gemmatimonadales bacterium]|nr:c-type cytochrome [Gemmatimonadales bacterium]
MRSIVILAGTLSSLVAALPGQGKFPPDSFTNLKVLPKNIDQRTLITTMRGFALALGVRCTYCHVGREGAPLDSVNFAKDDKRTKKVARVMLHMVMHINEEHLKEVPERPRPLLEVRCATCHRGVARPRLLDDELTLMLADSGLDAAVRRYRTLRERYYGSGSYDFREFVLSEVARMEARAGRTDNALGLLRLNAEYNPASADIPLTLGEVYRQRKDTAAAIANYQAALAKDSTLMIARQRLAELMGRSGPSPH